MFSKNATSKFKKMPSVVPKIHMRSKGAAKIKRCLFNRPLINRIRGTSASKQKSAIIAASDRLWDIETGGSVTVTM